MHSNSENDPLIETSYFVPERIAARAFMDHSFAQELIGFGSLAVSSCRDYWREIGYGCISGYAEENGDIYPVQMNVKFPGRIKSFIMEQLMHKEPTAAVSVTVWKAIVVSTGWREIIDFLTDSND